MKTIGLIRHGETAWNRLGKAQGHSDIPLNPLGREQAHQVGQRLKSMGWEKLYASDLLRAKETAQIIGGYSQLPLHTDRRLRERHGGLIEGLTEAERIEAWGMDWREADIGIESGEAMSKRGLDFFDDILREPEKKILIVSHGAFLKQILRSLIGTEAVNRSLANCSVTILQKDEAGWHLSLHNCCRHFKKGQA